MALQVGGEYPPCSRVGRAPSFLSWTVDDKLSPRQTMFHYRIMKNSPRGVMERQSVYRKCSFNLSTVKKECKMSLNRAWRTDFRAKTQTFKRTTGCAHLVRPELPAVVCANSLCNVLDHSPPSSLASVISLWRHTPLKHGFPLSYILKTYQDQIPGKIRQRRREGTGAGVWLRRKDTAVPRWISKKRVTYEYV